MSVDDEEYTVGTVAKRAGVSVRLLHHYVRDAMLANAGRPAS